MITSLALYALLSAAGVPGAALAQSISKPRYVVDLKIALTAETTTASKLVKAGEPFTVAGWKDGKKWTADFLLTQDKNDLLALKTQFYIDGKTGGVSGTRMLPGASPISVVVGEDGTSDTLATIEQSVKLAPKAATQERRVP
ncbi:MAG TPA: hypothetical protein VGC21_01055 [Telluria sp.]